MNLKKELTIILSTRERVQDLFQRARPIPFKESKVAMNDYFQSVALQARKAFPTRITEILKACYNQPPAYIIFKNLPFTSLDKDALNQKTKPDTLSENILMGLALFFGQPYGVTPEGNTIISDLIPNIEKRNEYSGLGYDVELDFHTENAAIGHLYDHECSPDGLLLIGVHPEQNPSPLTRLANLEKALEQLSQETIALLQQPLFQLKIPVRWRGFLENEQQETEPMSIISYNKASRIFHVAFYGDMITASLRKATQALTALRKSIEDVAIDLVINPGDAVYINNRISAHARTPWNPFFLTRDMQHDGCNARLLLKT